MKDSALTCPGPVGQRGPIAAKDLAYSYALAPLKRAWADAGLSERASMVREKTNVVRPVIRRRPLWRVCDPDEPTMLRGCRRRIARAWESHRCTSSMGRGWDR